MEDQRLGKRKRSAIACDACRTRRTKCNSQRPSCRYCSSHGIECIYQDPPAEPASRVERDLAAVKERLDYLIQQVSRVLPSSPAGHLSSPRNNESVADDDSPFDLPSKLLGNSSVMHVLGLDRDFAQALLRRERLSSFENHSNGAPRMLLVQHQQAMSALTAFSAKIHIWYPILPTGFSEEYFRVLSGSLQPSSGSSLSLLVAAVGCLAQDGEVGPHTAYFETALASLPILISESSVRSVQCLLLISIYYCCLLKPCQAYDYCLIASSSIQTLIKSGLDADDPDTLELTHRTYWAVLLLENELGSQLDVARSNIWSLDEHVPLPLCRDTWQFPPENGSPGVLEPTLLGIPVSKNVAEDPQSYFLAEIAMRRMLRRCNSALQPTSEGTYTYAPGIALELERQLEEWYRCLPDAHRFDKGNVSHPLQAVESASCVLSNFLRVQYYCCKMSIYWPAVYHVIQGGTLTDPLSDHCQRFFDSYVLLSPSILSAFDNCQVHRWTLFVSIFMTSVAVMAAADTPFLSHLCSIRLRQYLRASAHAHSELVEKSPSLIMLQSAMERRLSDAGSR